MGIETYQANTALTCEKNLLPRSAKRSSKTCPGSVRGLLSGFLGDVRGRVVAPLFEESNLPQLSESQRRAWRRLEVQCPLRSYARLDCHVDGFLTHCRGCASPGGPRGLLGLLRRLHGDARDLRLRYGGRNLRLGGGGISRCSKLNGVGLC